MQIHWHLVQTTRQEGEIAREVATLTIGQTIAAVQQTADKPVSAGHAEAKGN